MRLSWPSCAATSAAIRACEGRVAIARFSEEMRAIFLRPSQRFGKHLLVA
jgi:hypothetical protein